MMAATPPSEDMETTAAGAMLRCAFAVHRMAEQLARTYDVGAREVLAILEIAMSGPFSGTELGERTYLTRGAVSGLVRRLEEGGWVEVEPDPLDGRRMVVRASDRPRALLDEWVEMFRRDLAEAGGSDGPCVESIDTCVQVLERYRTRLRSLGPAEVRELVSPD